jgi:hypothetical protein
MGAELAGQLKKHRCGKNSASAELCPGPTFPGWHRNYPVTMPMVRRGLTSNKIT